VPAWRQEHGRSFRAGCPRGVDGARHHVRSHHHAGAAAERHVVNGAMPVGREVAQIDRLEPPAAFLQRPTGQRMAQRSRKHLRK
jgi:hypothetical protein